MKLSLRYYGDPILRQVATPVERFDDELRELAEAMIEMLYSENGIGLAAPQVGTLKRFLVALKMRDPDDIEADPLVLVNPKIVRASAETWSYEEGCLSIPGVVAPVIRPQEVEVSYQDLDGQFHTISDAGLFGRILQHEINHLDGELFIDHLSTAQKSLVKSKLKNLAENRA